mgnify:FL=1
MESDYLGIRKQLTKYKKVQNLTHHINKESLIQKHKELNGNKTTGVDKVTKVQYNASLETNIDNLLARMKKMQYKPIPSKRVYIEKANGKLRPLGIPSYEDKIVQGVIADILNIIYEPKFLDCSYGFRPNRDCHMAIKRIDEIIMKGKTNYIVEADIKGFFDNINHDWLIKFLEHDIDDKVFIRYIKRFLIAGIMQDGKYYDTETGTPQGGLISPILANVYLHYVLDLWFELYVKVKCKRKCYLVRYADDFVACFENQEEAEWYRKELIERLAKFNLEIENNKTRIFPFEPNSTTRDNFDFLGFTIHNGKTRTGKYAVKYKTNEKKSKQKKENIKEYLKLNRDIKITDIIAHLNKVLIGYYNYYGISFNFNWLVEIYDYTIQQLKKWLSRRSQRGKITWERITTIIRYCKLAKPRIMYPLW